MATWFTKQVLSAKQIRTQRRLVDCLLRKVPGHPTGAAMNKRETEECLKRAEECARQADAALDPELKIYLMKLALSWTQAAGETVERELRAAPGRLSSETSRD
jgi:hypothetical protein